MSPIHRYVKSPRTISGLAVACALLIALAGGALASDRFSDVPTNHIFHADINWLADTGITGGCATGKFCPGSPVSRGQMAAFLHRLVNQNRVGYYSCPGGSFLATDNAVDWARGDAETYAATTDGENLFRCNVAVPHGATLNSVTFTIADFDPGADVTCALVRVNLASSIGTTVTQGSISTTSTSGAQSVTDTTLTNTLVENDKYAYFAQCQLAGSSQTTIYGASVKYTYKGVPAP